MPTDHHHQRQEHQQQDSHYSSRAYLSLVVGVSVGMAVSQDGGKVAFWDQLSPHTARREVHQEPGEQAIHNNWEKVQHIISTNKKREICEVAC